MSEHNRAMKSFGLRFAGFIDANNQRVGVYVSWLILAMTLISAANAVSRKTFSVSSNAFLEIQWYLFAAVFLLAAGYTLQRNEHVRVDNVSGRMETRVRLWVELFGTVCFLFPFAALVIYFGWPNFMLSFASGEVSLNAGGLLVWPVKLLIPVAFIALLLQDVKLHPYSKDIMTAALKAAHQLYEEESAENQVFRRFYQSWKVFRYAQYQWYRIAETSFSNFMAGQQLPFKRGCRHGWVNACT
jgi:TRAP-type mannitol/chloroaromatic compound transport system permease small subunit